MTDREKRLSICWAGWTGPEMAEMASGILKFDPDPLFYILGSGASRDESSFYHGHGRRVSYFWDNERFFEDMNEGGFEVMIHNTYIYAIGHRPEIYPLQPPPNFVIVNPRWQDLKPFRILHEAESFTQMEFYHKIIHKYDGVITYNKLMKDYCDEQKIPCFKGYVCCPSILRDEGLKRDVDVSYSGSNLSLSYRGEIKQVLEGMSSEINLVIEEGAFSGLNVVDYYRLLNRSKIHQCTHSSANGEKHPMHPKNREGKALLCGAMPIIENFPEADDFLAPGKEKVVFEAPEELPELIRYYLEHEDERRAIVTAGQKKIRENYTFEIFFENAFRAFGLI